MRTPRPRSDRRLRGFTLLELGIVLGVAAILAAAIAPDMIESARTRMAEKAAQDVALLHDSARWFYIESGRSVGNSYRWPGQAPNSSTCTPATFTKDNAMADMLLNGYLSGGDRANPILTGAKFLKNPWGRSYDMDAYEPPMSPGGLTPGCMFGVATNLPSGVAEAFISFLPQAGCNGPAGNPCPPDPAGVPAGYVRCCSYVPKPGFEMWKNMCPNGAPIPDPVTNVLKCP